MTCKICGAKAHSEYCFKHKPRSKNLRKPTGELEVFKSIWNTRPRVSFISGIKLGTFNVSMFAHVLPKGKYPRYRLNEENIVLLTPREHSLLDQGTHDQRDKYKQEMLKSKYILVDWEKLFNLAEKLKLEYNERDQSPS